MIEAAIIFVFVVISVECFLYLPFVSRTIQLIKTIQKATKTVISKRISDHWKERVLLHYAQAIFINTLYLFLLLLGIVLLITGLAFVFDQLVAAPLSILAILSAPKNWVGMTLAAILYGYIRNKIARNVTHN